MFVILWDKKDEGVLVYENMKTQWNCDTTEYSQTSEVKEGHNIRMAWLIAQAAFAPPAIVKRQPLSQDIIISHIFFFF